MKQISEDYVSFEISKLLKEKKALIDYTMGYDEDGNLCNAMKCGVIDGKRVCILNGNDKLLMAPTQSMVMRWLREVYNLHITVKPYITEEGIMYLFEIYKLEAEKFTLIKTKTGFEKSELANEAAIKYSLENLI